MRKFFSNNMVVIVMIPMLFGAHYTWYRLQQVDNLVSPEERNKLPITRVLDKYTSKD